jgi:hypothetical protein
MATIHSKPLTTKTREAVWHQRNADRQRSDKIIESPDIRPYQTRQGTALYLKRDNRKAPADNPSGSVFRFKIVTVQNDFLVCNEVDDTGTVTNVANSHVAKPEHLRLSTATAGYTWIDSNSRSTALVNPNVTLSQALSPAYVAGQIIYAVGEVATGAIITGTVAAGNAVYTNLIEVVPARVWTDPLQAVCVTVNGVQYRMWVRGSAYAT